MKTSHGRGADGTGAKDVHSFVQAVVDDEVVGHADAVGFHGVALAVVVVSDFGVVKVGDAAGGGGGGGSAGHGHIFFG